MIIIIIILMFFILILIHLCFQYNMSETAEANITITTHKKNNTNFTEKQLWHYFIQTVRGLKALHDLKICHRDIKCANLFLTKAGVVKLGDLNVSKVAKRGLLRTQTGTPSETSHRVINVASKKISCASCLTVFAVVWIALFMSFWNLPSLFYKRFAVLKIVWESRTIDVQT